MTDLRRIGGAAALASAAAGFAGLGAALAMSPWFSWSADALSDLGHPRETSSGVFNAGLLASGVLFVVMAAVLVRTLPQGTRAKAAGAMLAAGGASLSLIGIITEAWGTPHFVVSFTYFTFVPMGMVLTAWASPGRARFGRVTWAASVASWAFGISILTAIAFEAPFTSQAVPELAASLINGCWAVAVGLELLRAPAAPPTPGPRPSP